MGNGRPRDSFRVMATYNLKEVRRALNAELCMLPGKISTDQAC